MCGCYRLADQEEQVGDAFFGRTEAVLCSQEFDLPGNFNYADFCSRNVVAGHKQSKRSLRSINDNILTQVVDGHRDVQVDFILTNKDCLTGDMKVEGR